MKGSDETVKIILTTKKIISDEDLLKSFENTSNPQLFVDLTKKYKKAIEDFSFVNSDEFMARKLLSLKKEGRSEYFFVRGELPIKLYDSCFYKNSLHGPFLYSSAEQQYIELIGSVPREFSLNPLVFPRKEFILQCKAKELHKFLFFKKDLSRLFIKIPEPSFIDLKKTKNSNECSLYQKQIIEKLNLNISCQFIHLIFSFFPLLAYLLYLKSKDYDEVLQNYLKDIYIIEIKEKEKLENLEKERFESLIYFIYFSLNKTFPKTLEEGISVAKKFKKKFSYFFKSKPCEHMNSSLLIDLKGLKLKDNFYFCEHDNPIYCIHLVEYEDLKKNHISGEQLENFISQYKELNSNKKFSCRICGEEIGQLKDDLATEDFSVGVLDEYDELERKALRKECRYAVTNLEFKSLVSDEYKNFFASKIANKIFSRVMNQKSKIEKYKNITKEHKEAQTKIIINLYIYAYLAKVILNNSEILRFKSDKPLKFEKKQNSQKVFEQAVKILYNILNFSIKAIEEFTSINIESILRVTIEDFSTPNKIEIENKEIKNNINLIKDLSKFYYNSDIDNVKNSDIYENSFSKLPLQTRITNSLIYFYKNPIKSVSSTEITRKGFEFEINVIEKKDFINLSSFLKSLREEEKEYLKIHSSKGVYLLKSFSFPQNAQIFDKTMINLRYGIKGGVHQHNWDEGLIKGKTKNLKLFDSTNEIIEDIVCTICKEKLSEEKKDIIAFLQKDTEKKALLEFFKDFCPENITLSHVFKGEVCSKCGYGTDKFLKDYKIPENKLNAEKEKKINLIKEFKEEKIIKLEPKFYSINLKNDQYKNLFEGIGRYEDVEYDELLKGKFGEEKIGRLNIKSLFLHFIIFLQRLVNFEKFDLSDPGSEKKTLITISSEISEFYKKIDDFYSYNFLKFKFIQFFNSLPKNTGIAYAQELNKMHKEGAKSNILIHTSAVSHDTGQEYEENIDIESDYNKGQNDFTYKNFDYNGENSEIA